MTSPGSSPYATRDPERHAAQIGRVDAAEVHEFYGPFTMVDDLIELAHIVSPGYSELDTCLLLEPKPVQVYTDSAEGERYLRERYPNARRFRLEPGDLLFRQLEDGRTLVASLRAATGPYRELDLVVRQDRGAKYVAERYEGQGVWGSAGLACYGIDMRTPARARGRIVWEDGRVEAVDRRAVIFRGSYGKIQPVPGAAVTPAAPRANRR